ncbi:hypothetical protein ABT071_37815 [Streptomyces sp. NPDC002506]|uniref:hypothetical protein n=1 Tax=Streptomyces sp. NPDC002506 TaxID=3154536 RepID=UPI003322AEFC
MAQNAFHGGSLRVVARADPHAISPSVDQLLREEAVVGITDVSFYADFARKVEDFLAASRKELPRQGSGPQQAGVMGHSITVSCSPCRAGAFATDARRIRQSGGRGAGSFS